MHEIKFRGKKTDNSNWVYGDLIREPWGMCIQYYKNNRRHKNTILTKTIGQFVGLYDINNKEIYVGDVLGGVWESCYIGYCEKCKQFQLFLDKCCMACLGDIHWYEIVTEDGKLKVVGNIWEGEQI